MPKIDDSGRPAPPSGPDGGKAKPNPNVMLAVGIVCLIAGIPLLLYVSMILGAAVLGSGVGLTAQSFRIR